MKTRTKPRWRRPYDELYLSAMAKSVEAAAALRPRLGALLRDLKTQAWRYQATVNDEALLRDLKPPVWACQDKALSLALEKLIVRLRQNPVWADPSVWDMAELIIDRSGWLLARRSAKNQLQG
jgi:hypothetical protein